MSRYFHLPPDGTHEGGGVVRRAKRDTDLRLPARKVPGVVSGYAASG